MKHLVLWGAFFASTANLALASDVPGLQVAGRAADCAAFHSVHDMRMTPGAQQACPEVYVRLRMLEERNQPKQERTKEEQVTLAVMPASHPA